MAKKKNGTQRKERVNWKKVAGEAMADQAGAEEKIKELVKSNEEKDIQTKEHYGKFLNLSERYSKIKGENKNLIEQHKVEIEKLDVVIGKRDRALSWIQNKSKKLKKRNAFLRKRLKEMTNGLAMTNKKLKCLTRMLHSKIYKVIWKIEQRIIELMFEIRWKIKNRKRITFKKLG